MKYSIFIQEEGLNTFLIKDTTGISNNPLDQKLFSYTEEISTSNPRPQDLIFLDFVVYNKINSAKIDNLTYTMINDEDYLKYAIHYKCEKDGWYSIAHYYIYSSFYLNYLINQGTITEGTYYCYNNGYTEELEIEQSIDLEEGCFGTVNINDGQVTSTSKIDDINSIYLTTSNAFTYEAITEDIFSIGLLEECFGYKIKEIIYNGIYCNCGEVDSIKMRDRDMIWMTIELIKYLVKHCRYFEAQRILEKIDTCNSFCNNYNNIDSKLVPNCGCSKL